MLKLIKQARAAFSMLGPDEIANRANREVHIGMVAAASGEYDEMESLLIPASASERARQAMRKSVHRAEDASVPKNVDIVLYADNIEGPNGTYQFYRGDPRRTV